MIEEKIQSTTVEQDSGVSTHADFAGLTFDNALDIIKSIPSAERQAELLVGQPELLATPRGTAMMKSLASAATPYRQRLHDVLVAREAERARKKAAPARRKGRVKGDGIVMPDLFVIFGAAPPSEEAKNTEAAPPPENIGEGTHGEK
jgi:hypothetical protein